MSKKAKEISVDELACTYAALILADDDVTITADKITTILNAAGLTVESIWPALFARALSGVNIKELITNIGSMVIEGSEHKVEGSSTLEGTATEKKEEQKKEEPKEEAEDESDEDFGFGLFD